MHEIVGEDELAEKTYEQAVEVYPTNPIAHFLMGTFFRDRGNRERARQAFAAAIKLQYTPAIGMNIDELRSPPE
jgi:Tfp pilus assembly protein PilF